MIESFPNKTPEEEKMERKRQYIELAQRLSENLEGFPFPGIDPQSYAKLKEEEQELSGFVTPIDEVIEKFNNEGIKIVLGKDKESGNVFVLPKGSDDVRNESVLPRHLNVTEGMDDELKRLVLLNRK